MLAISGLRSMCVGIMLLSGLAVAAPEAGQKGQVWLEIQVQEIKEQELVKVQLPSSWLEEGTLGVELQNELTRKKIDLAPLIASMEKQPVGTRQEVMHLEEPDQLTRMYLEHRVAPAPTAARATKILLKVKNDGADKIDLSIGLPLSVARLVFGVLESSSSNGKPVMDDVSDAVRLEKVFHHLESSGPVVLVEVKGPGEYVLIATE